jgi:hypothetical protein
MSVHPSDLKSYVQFVSDLNEGIDQRTALDNARRLALDQKDCLNRYKNRDPSRTTEVTNTHIIKLSTALDQVQTSLIG